MLVNTYCFVCANGDGAYKSALDSQESFCIPGTLCSFRHHQPFCYTLPSNRKENSLALNRDEKNSMHNKNSEYDIFKKESGKRKS